MASEDSDNAIKYLLYHLETGSKVFFHVLNWLYQGRSPIECLVIDLANTEKIILDGDEEKKMIDELENGTIDICDLNLTLLYKITRSICGLLRNEKEHKQLWSKSCPSNEKAELEHLLFLLNDGQNSARTITKSDLELILQQAGQRGDKDFKEINDAISKMHDYYELICNDEKIDRLTKYNRCGSYVINTILPWLYQGWSPIKDLVIDLTKMKTIKIDDTQKKVLTGLRNKDIKLSDLDISFLFQIIQSVCGLPDRNDYVWGKKDKLEFLISKLKNSRNDVAHRFLEFKKMTDSELDVKSDEMRSLLTSIIEKAGQKANIDARDTITLIQDDIERIRNNGEINDYMKSRILEQILNDLKFSNKAELKSSFENELKGYSAPYLRSNNEGSIPLRDLLTFEDQIIVVQGEAGEGKTSLTKFLYNSWLFENMNNTNIMEGLSSFEVVLRVDCNQIFSSDIILFYEKTFPIASSAFHKKGSLKKSFDEFKVLWIMDGFDECTTELKGFLTAMTNSLSERHKLLITTRPHTYEDLKKYLSELSMTSLTLELLQDRNVEEIIQSLITEDKKKRTFKTHFKIITLDKTTKHLLRTPLNLNLYIKLWMQDPELVRDTFTTKLLFLKTIEHNLSLLQERLVGRTCWSSEDLKGYVKDWFYGSLCKQSFLIPNIIRKEDLDTLRKDARDSKLDPSSCLSAFLVQEKKNDWEDEGEFRYEFHHLTQQFILASLFLKHFKDYDGENVIFNIPRNIFQNVGLMAFYVEMITEDGSLDKDFTQVFSPIQCIINTVADIRHKSDIWFLTSVASKFNVKYMEKVSQAFKDIPYLYIYCPRFDFNDSLELTNLKIFLEFVRPQKTILSNLSFEKIQKEDFQPLFEFLINSKLEIEIENFDYDYFSFESDDAFCGKFFLFLHCSERRKWTQEMKTICIDVDDQYELNRIDFEMLKEHKALKRLEIWINLDSWLYLIETNIHNLPKKEMVEITTIGLIGLNIENFGRILEVLNKMKVKEALKFKALHHDFEDISETNKRQLQKIAHTVSIDFICICQCKKYVIANIDKLNITSFDGDMQLLNALNAHRANLKSVFLKIESIGELYRTLKFFRDYKGNLKDLIIQLRYTNRFPKLVIPEHRTSTNILAIPQELMQHTSICIRNINENNFEEYFKLLNNLRGDETLKFKAVYTDHTSLNHYQLEMFDQITGKSFCMEDKDFWIWKLTHSRDFPD